jgi:molybdenum cofactor biosynthesis enzyme MoaA
MNIYHISYTEKFVGERMAMLSFKGCNFNCIGCIRGKNEYDIYAEERRYIDWNFENIVKELEKLNPHRIYLGGYEPTLDPDLIRIIGNISKLDAHIVLMTNGSKIGEGYAIELKEAGVNEVIVGVKAFDRKKHLYYTKRSNEVVLNTIKNLAAMEDAYFRLQVETILLPGINDPADIEELAIFISQINPAISLFIEPWIPIEGVEFEEPEKEDLIDAVSRAMKHLYVVSYHPLYSEIKEIRETSRKAKFIEILPEEKKGEQEQ